MSEPFGPEQGEEEVDEQHQGDREGHGVEEAHEGSRGASHTAISMIDSRTRTTTSPSHTRSTGPLLSSPLDERGRSIARQECRAPHQERIKIVPAPGSRPAARARVRLHATDALVRHEPRMNPRRPDPEAFLERIRQEGGDHARGRLKVFFGASAGVGKTFAMLVEAHERRRAGTDVVVGVIETHGRTETASLLEGLEVLPLRPVEYKGTTLREFDLDAALARRPALILVDELAHTNAPGSRHAKRWLDIDELLQAGIEVYTTLNVQHVESVYDVVAQITGVSMR